ncbi:MAG: STAS domain-containing protein [Planctomycetaceae bacterium]|nr:STAS domain-containing protein [Planctomycetaceae bacterium]
MRCDIVQQGAVIVARIDGIMTLENLDTAHQHLLARAQKRQPRMLLDLTGVPLIDSSALELMVELQAACNRRGGGVKLVGLNVLCEEILQITGLLSQFEVFDNQITAMGSFAT